MSDTIMLCLRSGVLPMSYVCLEKMESYSLASVWYIDVDCLQHGHSSGICDKSISLMFSVSVVRFESAMMVSLFSFSAVSM